MRRYLIVMAAFVALLFAVSAAWAIPPETGSYTFSVVCEDEDDTLYDCGDFLICEGGTGEADWKLFFDKNGDPKKYREKVKFDGYVYEFGNPDNRLDYLPLNYTVTIDQITGDVIVTGVFAMLTVPGHGQIFRDVGRIIFDIDGFIVFEAGEHEYWNDEWEAVCTFLGAD